MSFESPEKNSDTNETLAAIENLRAQAQQMGANDYEQSAFNAIREKLEAQQLTPEEARAAAQNILDSKVDYH